MPQDVTTIYGGNKFFNKNYRKNLKNLKIFLMIIKYFKK